MIEKEFSDHEDEEEELFQIKAKRKHDDQEDEEEKEETEEDDNDNDEEDEEEDESTSPPARKYANIGLKYDENNNFDQLFRRQAKMSNGNSSIPTTDEFLSIVKKKFDRRKDRVKTLSVDDF
jgi:hypothetical protein